MSPVTMHHSLPFLLSCLSLTSTSLAQTSGTFNALSFNVAGLPAFLQGNGIPGDKTANTARIGQLFTQYNFSLIHVQEDFNYHSTLYANDAHPYRTPTSGGVPFGSGLNTLSSYEFTGLQRIKWDKCSTFDSADCLTPKGFTFMRVKFGENTWIDAYNLHADAGSTNADNVARASNLRQISNYIKTNSAGNPVLVFGDSNSRYTRAVDIPTVFSSENGMEDAWVKLIRSGTPPAPGSDTLECDNPAQSLSCETVDKVWFRGSSAVQLQAINFQYAGDRVKQENGNILSDHNPVLVDFSWNLATQWRASAAFGGENGNWYNDLNDASTLGAVQVSSITLRGGSRLNAVSMTLASGQTFSHGGTGGTATTLALNAGETLVGATLCSGETDGKTRIFYASVRTSSGRSIASGVKTSTCVERTAESGFGFVGFLGRSGDEVDQLGFVSKKI